MVLAMCQGPLRLLPFRWLVLRQLAPVWHAGLGISWVTGASFAYRLRRLQRVQRLPRTTLESFGDENGLFPFFVK